MDDVLVDRYRAGELLNVSVHRIRQLANDPRVPLHRLRNELGRVRYRESEVLALKAKRETYRADGRKSA
jgi:hypothetical protein